MTLPSGHYAAAYNYVLEHQATLQCSGGKLLIIYIDYLFEVNLRLTPPSSPLPSPPPFLRPSTCRSRLALSRNVERSPGSMTGNQCTLSSERKPAAAVFKLMTGYAWFASFLLSHLAFLSSIVSLIFWTHGLLSHLATLPCFVSHDLDLSRHQIIRYTYSKRSA
ncbi:hypothetical protein BDY19DRAFT_322891 [Irpex rosettiformis]|uniref:Uncharacterized protein n=1 Tax=Irpex rosettiformis TaxID=378272 RepID=A0ACB8TYJ1_9APHY|nr:hypothetical protein BDY19DRAFT_322891 [Irpex rosettiformis]